jgi:hypothetical protein
MKKWGIPLPKSNQQGFTIVELVMACAIFPIIVIGLSNAADAARKMYMISRQYNEIYTVLSACPEIDRSLDFSSISGSTNCFPNNTFSVEAGVSGTITYNPTLTVQDTSALPAADPLRTIPDSKVIDISVGFPNSPTFPLLKIKMLVTRNGIGQL